MTIEAIQLMFVWIIWLTTLCLIVARFDRRGADYVVVGGLFIIVILGVISSVAVDRYIDATYKTASQGGE